MLYIDRVTGELSKQVSQSSSLQKLKPEILDKLFQWIQHITLKKKSKPVPTFKKKNLYIDSMAIVIMWKIQWFSDLIEL